MRPGVLPSLGCRTRLLRHGATRLARIVHEGTVLKDGVEDIGAAVSPDARAGAADAPRAPRSEGMAVTGGPEIRLRGDCALSESELIREGIERITREDDGYDMQALIGPDVRIGRGPRDLARNTARRAGVWSVAPSLILATSSRFEEHIFPVTLDVLGYVRKRRPAEIEMAAAAALTHDVPEDLDWSGGVTPRLADRRAVSVRRTVLENRDRAMVRRVR